MKLDKLMKDDELIICLTFEGILSYCPCLRKSTALMDKHIVRCTMFHKLFFYFYT